MTIDYNGSLYKEIKFCFISRRWIYCNLFLCFSTSLDVICPHRKRRENDIFPIVLRTDFWTDKENYSFPPETVGSWWKISSPGRISCVATRPLPLPGMLVNLNCIKKGSQILGCLFLYVNNYQIKEHNYKKIFTYDIIFRFKMK